VSIFKESNLKQWFEKEKWVDVSRPKKDGGYEECGRSDADKGRYPVCTPASKAKTLSDKERKNRIRAKRKNEKKKRKGKSPHMTQYTEPQGGKSNPKMASTKMLSHLSKSCGLKIETSLRKCLELYNDHMFDLTGEWEYDKLISPQDLLDMLDDLVLDLPVIIDSKHVVINLPNSGVEVFNMIPEYLIHTTKGK
jgi:hypothetical protein